MPWPESPHDWIEPEYILETPGENSAKRLQSVVILGHITTFIAEEEQNEGVERGVGVHDKQSDDNDPEISERSISHGDLILPINLVLWLFTFHKVNLDSIVLLNCLGNATANHEKGYVNQLVCKCWHNEVRCLAQD